MNQWKFFFLFVLFVGCQEDNENSKKVCNNFQSCILGTWNIEVNTLVNGTLAPFGGTPGSVTFNSDKTGTSTGNIFQGYASGNYYNSFTYEVDNSKYILKIFFDIPLSNPTQSELYTVKYAYENEINMETPMIGGMINVTLKK